MFSRKNVIAIFVFAHILLTSTTTAAPSDPVCDCDGTYPSSCNGPVICARFDNMDDPPDEPSEVTFSFDANGIPTVTLVQGDDGTNTYEWRVWADVSDSDGTAADIALIEGTNAEDYWVTILDDDNDGPGAADVGGINLNPSDDGKYSRILDGHLTGDLSGTTFVQARDLPQNPPPVESEYGDIENLTVDGSVTGSVTAEQINTMTIENDLTATGSIDVNFVYDYVLVKGDAAGDIVVDNLLDEYMVKILGDASGDITVDQFQYGALLQIDGTASGAIDVLQDLESQGASDAEVQLGSLTGSLDISGDLDGIVDINGASSGTIDVGGATSGTIDILNDCTGAIELTGACSGDVIVGGDQRAAIILKNDLTSAGSITVDGDVVSDISISGDCAGDLILNSHLIGDVDITLDVDSTGSIVIDESIKSTGRVLVGGLLDGELSVGTETVALSQIKADEGLGSNRCIIINADQARYDANGVIHFGPATIPDPLNDITFDGGIKIYDQLDGQRRRPGGHDYRNRLPRHVGRSGHLHRRRQQRDDYAEPERLYEPGVAFLRRWLQLGIHSESSRLKHDCDNRPHGIDVGPQPRTATFP